MTNFASLLKHRGCHRAAPVCIRSPLRSARGLASSPWFAAGWGLAAVAWLIHVAALSMAPISLVQAALAAGAVSPAVLSPRAFRGQVEARPGPAPPAGGFGVGPLALSPPSIPRRPS